jgi:hypothetical protein
VRRATLVAERLHRPRWRFNGPGGDPNAGFVTVPGPPFNTTPRPRLRPIALRPWLEASRAPASGAELPRALQRRAARLWFLDRGKRGTLREKTVLFLDARNTYRQIDRAHRDFRFQQIDGSTRPADPTGAENAAVRSSGRTDWPLIVWSAGSRAEGLRGPKSLRLVTLDGASATDGWPASRLQLGGAAINSEREGPGCVGAPCWSS